MKESCLVVLLQFFCGILSIGTCDLFGFSNRKNVEKQKPFASNSYCIICGIIYLDSVCHHVIFIMIPLTFLIILFCFALSPQTCFQYFSGFKLGKMYPLTPKI